jgi:hypothetical protein
MYPQRAEPPGDAPLRTPAWASPSTASKRPGAATLSTVSHRAFGCRRDDQRGERVGLGDDTVGIWRQRFASKRLEGLYDEPRVGRPREIGDDQVEAVVVATLESKPDGATHWSTRHMAKKMGLTQSAVKPFAIASRVDAAKARLAWRCRTSLAT